jgi:hypothetical protein
MRFQRNEQVVSQSVDHLGDEAVNEMGMNSSTACPLFNQRLQGKPSTEPGCRSELIGLENLHQSPYPQQ